MKREMGGENVYLTSFLNAAAWRITQRVEEIVDAASRGELSADGENMLVPMSVYEEAWSRAEEKFPEDVRRINTKMSANSASAAQRGIDEADKVNLGRQIGGTGRAQKMLGRG